MIRPLLAAVALVAIAGCGSDGVASSSGTKAAAGAAKTNAPKLAYATYAWNASDVVSRWRAGTLWNFARALYVRDFMLGFTDADIARYSKKSGAAEINAMIADGKKHGVAFELLLGDPSWIVPAGIPVLERILHRLRVVRFARVNLDLEPSEVRNLPVKTVVMDLAAAMKQYVANSPWPVTLDANWIYMNNGNRFNGGYCLPCGLQTAGLKNVALMVYIADPKTAFDVSGPILKRYPELTFTISQSVEPPSVLPKRDSYWHAGFTSFYTDMQKLDAKMRARTNYAGINVQSLQYLETMPL